MFVNILHETEIVIAAATAGRAPARVRPWDPCRLSTCRQDVTLPLTKHKNPRPHIHRHHSETSVSNSCLALLKLLKLFPLFVLLNEEGLARSSFIAVSSALGLASPVSISAEWRVCDCVGNAQLHNTPGSSASRTAAVASSCTTSVASIALSVLRLRIARGASTTHTSN